MRIVLAHGHVPFAQPPKLPAGMVLFVCHEDFTMGPLRDWNDQPKFWKARAAYWRQTPVLDLPDGTKMDYVVWLQALPRYDLVDLLTRGTRFEDLPETHRFEDVAPKATAIEIWWDRTPGSTVLLWYLSAALEGLGIDPSGVSVCAFPGSLREDRPQAFWSDMLLDRPGRAIPAVPLGEAERQVMARCWSAAVDLPAPIDPALMTQAAPHVLDTFDVLKGRHPNAETGLTNLEARLLHATHEDWRKMARVVGDAMGAGWDENDEVGDGVLQAALEEMAQRVPPLVEVKGTGEMRFCRARLAPAGLRQREALRDPAG
ncbi:MAG: hypothetical protein AAFY65_15800 [Pseudomonadota bacterium]